MWRDVGKDHGTTGRHRFQHGHWQALAARSGDEDVGLGVRNEHVVPRDQAGEVDVVAHAQVVGAETHRSLELARTDDDEPALWVGPPGPAARLEERSRV